MTRIAVVGFGLTLALASRIAAGDPPRYTRAEPKLALDARTPIRAKVAAVASGTPAAVTAPPPTGTGGKKPRAEDERVLIELIRSTPDSEVDEKADYYFRLGETYARYGEQARLDAAAAVTPEEVRKPRRASRRP